MSANRSLMLLARLCRASKPARILASPTASVPPMAPASMAMSRSRMLWASCSKEKRIALRLAVTVLRSICSAIAVLPRPCGPPSSTSSPDRKPPVSATSSASKPVGHTRAPAVLPTRSFSSVSARTSLSDRVRAALRGCTRLTRGATGRSHPLVPRCSCERLNPERPCVRGKSGRHVPERMTSRSVLMGQFRHRWSRGTPRSPRSRPRDRSRRPSRRRTERPGWR